MTDPDEALLQPGADKRACVAARAINRLTKEQQEKVTVALAQPKKDVPGKNIAEYIYRKLAMADSERFHLDSLARHRRGDCGCR